MHFWLTENDMSMGSLLSSLAWEPSALTWAGGNQRTIFIIGHRPVTFKIDKFPNPRKCPKRHPCLTHTMYPFQKGFPCHKKKIRSHKINTLPCQEVPIRERFYKSSLSLCVANDSRCYPWEGCVDIEQSWTVPGVGDLKNGVGSDLWRKWPVAPSIVFNCAFVLCRPTIHHHLYDTVAIIPHCSVSGRVVYEAFSSSSAHESQCAFFCGLGVFPRSILSPSVQVESHTSQESSAPNQQTSKLTSFEAPPNGIAHFWGVYPFVLVLSTAEGEASQTLPCNDGMWLPVIWHVLPLFAMGSYPPLTTITMAPGWLSFSFTVGVLLLSAVDYH